MKDERYNTKAVVEAEKNNRRLVKEYKTEKMKGEPATIDSLAARMAKLETIIGID